MLAFVIEIIVLLLLAFGACCVFVFIWNLFGHWHHLCYIRDHATRLTNLFVLLPKYKKERQVIEQHICKLGKKQVKNFRKKHATLPIRIKMIAVSKFFSKELSLLLDKLTPEQSYSCTTHLLQQLKHAEQKRNITIQQSRFERKKVLFETITLIGMRDFFRCILDNKLRPLLRRNFFLVHFTKTSATDKEVSHEESE